MHKSLLRTYQSYDVTEVKEHLLVHGALSSTCGKCQAMNLTLGTPQCPECRAEFKYIAFQNAHQHMPKLVKITEQRPSICLIDYDDYKKSLGAHKAKKFLE